MMAPASSRFWPSNAAILIAVSFAAPIHFAEATLAQAGGSNVDAEAAARVNRALTEWERKIGNVGSQAAATSPAPTEKPMTWNQRVLQKAEKWWGDNPNAAAAIENEKNAFTVAAESAAGVHNVADGLNARAISGVGGVASTVGGLVISGGVEALNPETAVGFKTIWDRRGGAHPADSIDVNEGLSRPNGSAATSANRVNARDAQANRDDAAAQSALMRAYRQMMDSYQKLSSTKSTGKTSPTPMEQARSVVQSVQPSRPKTQDSEKKCVRWVTKRSTEINTVGTYCEVYQ